MNILVVPDGHALPGVSNKRFTLAGEYAARGNFDLIINLGDLWDFPSLCTWSARSELEGARFKADREAGEEAFSMFMDPIRSRKKKLPQMVFLEGNHEVRVDNICRQRPELTGIISSPKEYVSKQGWLYYTFEKVFSAAGWHFTHHFPSGIMGKPIGGKHVGNTLVLSQGVSCVQGHNHIFDHKVVNRRDGSPVHGITAGCFTHPTHEENWNSNVAHLYHRGLLELRNAQAGDASLAWTRMRDL